MAGRLHIDKGTQILQEPSLVETWVTPFDEEYQVTAYLKALPRLIRRTRVHDARCAKLWQSLVSNGNAAAYAEAHAVLARLFRRFRFTIHSYERLARQPDKPLLEQAAQMLNGHHEAGNSAHELESQLRLTLQQFLDLELATAADLCLVDELRGKILSSHEAYARRRAEALGGSDPNAARYALWGLSRASTYYTYRRGYRFRMYAKHWIETAIRQKKAGGTGQRPPG